jgi:hypothetical protein
VIWGNVTLVNKGSQPLTLTRIVFNPNGDVSGVSIDAIYIVDIQRHTGVLIGMDGTIPASYDTPDNLRVLVLQRVLRGGRHGLRRQPPRRLDRLRTHDSRLLTTLSQPPSPPRAAPPIAVWVPDPADPMRTSDYPVLCAIETDRTLFVLVRMAIKDRKREPVGVIHIEIDNPHVENRSLSGAGGRDDGLYMGQFDRPGSDVDSLDIVLTLQWGEPWFSRTRITRGFTI